MRGKSRIFSYKTMEMQKLIGVAIVKKKVKKTKSLKVTVPRCSKIP